MSESAKRLEQIKDHLRGAWLYSYEQVPVLKSITNLKDKVVVISGGSRGIGLSIGLKCAQDGAKLVILGKTAEQHKHLPGTIYSAQKECLQAGASGALAIQCDIRKEDNIIQAVNEIVQQYGKIDILVNSASAIKLEGLETLDMKKFDLMHSVNARGTYLMTKHCVPHLKKSSNPHVLNISPPLVMKSKWFANQCAYTIAKYSMSMHVLGFSEEFRGQIAFNALWPRTSIATAAVEFELGGKEMMRRSRKPEIMADSAYRIFCSDFKVVTGNFFFDDEILSDVNLNQYKIDPSIADSEIIPDFFY